jgi:hypothetical protein
VGAGQDGLRAGRAAVADVGGLGLAVDQQVELPPSVAGTSFLVTLIVPVSRVLVT